MADKTGISWTSATWNPLRGCSRVSEGCRRCYAETVAARFCGPGMPYEGLAKLDVTGNRRWTGVVKLVESAIDQPLRWRRPRTIFVNSMSDLFHEKVPDEWIDLIFAVMALSPQHTFQILTKRSARQRAYMTSTGWKNGTLDKLRQVAEAARFPAKAIDNVASFEWPLRNVWLGVSVEDQSAAHERIPDLLETPAAVRFISAEPLLEPIDLMLRPVDYGDWDTLKGREYYAGASRYCDSANAIKRRTAKIDWVICGGESGNGARPMEIGWARQLLNQCEIAGIPFFMKQLGGYPDKKDRLENLPPDLRIREFPI